MKNQDTVTIIITSLLVIPWFARVLASMITIWRASHLGKKREEKRTLRLG
jgi:hypothetical protein